MTENIENLKARNKIKRKSVENALNRTCQNHRRANLICMTKVIIKTRNTIIRRAIGKVFYQIMRKINGKVFDDII